MPRGDAEQSKRRTLGGPTISLPIAERVHADPERLGEPSLREPNETPQRGDVARRELTAHDARPLVSPESTFEVVSSELSVLLHVFFSMYSA